MIETRGFVNTVSLVDTMIKSAEVEFISFRHIGSGFMTAMIWGDLASVKHAIEAGAAQALSEGITFSKCIIPKIRAGTLELLFDASKVKKSK